MVCLFVCLYFRKGSFCEMEKDNQCRLRNGMECNTMPFADTMRGFEENAFELINELSIPFSLGRRSNFFISHHCFVFSCFSNPIRSEIRSGDESFYQTMGSIVCCRLGTLAILDCLSRRLWQAGEWNMGRSVRAHKSNSQFLSWKDCIESCCGAPMTRQKHWT